MSDIAIYHNQFTTFYDFSCFCDNNVQFHVYQFGHFRLKMEKAD